MATTEHQDADLPQVVSHYSDNEGLQPTQAGLIAYNTSGMCTDEGNGLQHDWKQPHEQDAQEQGLQQQHAGKVCGLRPWVFCAIVLCAAVVVVGAVVGGVAGSLAKDHASPSDASVSQTSTTASGTLSPSASPGSANTSASPTVVEDTITISIIASPSSTLYSDCPSSNNTIYSVHYDAYPTMYWRRFCGIVINSPDINSDDTDYVNQGSTSLTNCIDLCATWNVENQAAIANNTQAACSGVCWRNQYDTEYPGHCFGGATSNTSSGEFDLVLESKCDSAGWINQYP
ncbi:hypothetical protein LTR85_006351 [Meristemomyces frigidus]|nr:hypothetical protein LTR85_006351 [Meristemomyces frigidus]